jgi:DNA-binding transcriptional ArsR family regulator
MARKRRRLGRPVDATGRSKGDGQYASLSYEMLHSLAWRSLSGPAAKVWLELRTRFHGANNSKLILSMDEAARLLGLGKSTVRRALVELQDKGFVVCIRKGQWYGRLASEWSTTDRSVNGEPATNAWKVWRPNPAARPRKKTEVGTEMAPSAHATVPPEDRALLHGAVSGPVRALRLVATVPSQYR